MSAPQENGESSSSRLGDPSKPSAELQELIERVAEHVAQHGPTREFQLRSGQDGRQNFAFLYLDNENAPYYQHRLSEARRRRKVVATASTAALASTRLPLQTTGTSQQYQTMVENSPLTNPPLNHTISDTKSREPWRRNDDIAPDQVCLSAEPVGGEPISLTQQDRTIGQDMRKRCDIQPAANDDLTPRTRSSPSSQLHARQRSVASDQESYVEQHTNPATHSQRSTRPFIPYGVLQEVHLLDSMGTEQTGLNTYIILNNNDKEEDDPLTAWLNLPFSEYPPHEPIYYRLRPDTSTIFRAPHHRLLPVGFPLGAEVKQSGSIMASIIIRRTVEKGQRFYDVRDEFGETHKAVPEEALRFHSGGKFDFRLPHQT